uniref:Nucleoprotein n=1 Tax=Mburo virus TaxID=2035534 RepID=A0A290G8S4_9VIRU|nr:nucleocapsid [Mburo virus]
MTTPKPKNTGTKSTPVKVEDDLVFSFGGRADGSFDPRAGYINFMRDHGNEIADLSNINAFLLNAKAAKERLATRQRKQVALKFGNWTVTVVNNHHKANTTNPVGPDDLTIGRISGYIAYYLLKTHSEKKHKELIETTIINPIAESKGVTWDTPLIYLSMIPGSEMFMDEFEFYPLAIGIVRCQRKEMDVEYLKKPMRQMLSDGLASSSWLVSSKDAIKGAVNEVAKLSMTRPGFSQIATKFLQEFNIN